MKNREWLENIEHGKNFRKRFGKENQWNRLEDLFYGTDRNQDHEGPNLIASTGDSLLSQLCIQYPYIIVKPADYQSVKTAPILEAVDNQLIEDMRLYPEIENAILNAYLFGTGFLKVGYDSEWGFDTEFDAGGGEAEIGMSLTQFGKKGKRLEFDARIKPGMPWVKSVSPRDIIVPWGTRTLYDVEWIAHRCVRRFDSLREDPKYNVKGMSPTLSLAEAIGATTVDDRQKEYLEFYEIHDVTNGMIICVAPDFPDIKMREQESVLYEAGYHPFVAISFVPSTKSIWVPSDAFRLLNEQAELLDICNTLCKQRRLSNLRFFYDKTRLTQEEVDNFIEGEAGIAFGIDGGLRDAIIPLTPPNNNMILQQEAEYVRRNAREVVGLSRNQFGEYEVTGRRTAYEAAIVQRGSETRLSRREGLISRTYGDIFAKVNSLIFKFWSLPRFVQVARDDWRPVIGQELKGTYNYKIRLATEAVASQEQRKNAAMQLYMLLSRDPSMDPIKLRELVANAVGEDLDLGEVFSDAALRIQMSMRGAGGNSQQGTSQVPVRPDNGEGVLNSGGNQQGAG